MVMILGEINHPSQDCFAYLLLLISEENNFLCKPTMLPFTEPPKKTE